MNCPLSIVRSHDSPQPMKHPPNHADRTLSPRRASEIAAGMNRRAAGVVPGTRHLQGAAISGATLADPRPVALAGHSGDDLMARLARLNVKTPRAVARSRKCLVRCLRRTRGERSFLATQPAAMEMLKGATPRQGFFEKGEYEKLLAKLAECLRGPVTCAYWTGWWTYSGILILTHQRVAAERCSSHYFESSKARSPWRFTNPRAERELSRRGPRASPLRRNAGSPLRCRERRS
jgi:hypothetical protein